MGIVLIFKTSFTTNFAQGAIASFGAYTSAILSYRYGLGFIFSVLIGVLIGFIIGVAIDILLFRSARKINFVGKQIITMGLVLFITGLIPMVYNVVVPVPVARFRDGVTSFELLGMQLTITNHLIESLKITILVLAAIFIALRYTKWGLGVRATASNELVSSMMGINTRAITALSWGIAGGLGSIAAIMYASLTLISPSFMVPYQVNAFLASILGGFFTFFGPIVGAVLIPVVGNLIAFNFSVWKNVIVYVLILIVILIRPLGLFGKKIAKKV